MIALSWHRVAVSHKLMARGKEGFRDGRETGQVVFVYKKFKICTIPSYIYKHSLSWISITLGTREKEKYIFHTREPSVFMTSF